MKHQFESQEIFTAYATVEAGYYMLGQIKKQLDKPKSPIENAIDIATGFDKKIISNKAEEIVEILIDVIAAKKIIDADYSADEKMMSEVMKMNNVV